MLRQVSDLFRYKELTAFLVALDLKVRYRGSFLGFVWTLLNPVLLMLVLWAVFSRFGRIREENYALFLLSGLMTWTFFQQSTEQALNAVVRQRTLLQKIYVPKMVFPVTVVLSSLVNLLFFFLAYIVFAAFSGNGIPATTPLIIPVMLMLLLMSAGSALVMSALNVFFRDFTHLTGVMLRALFYVTPIIYPPHLLGDRAVAYMALNPLFYPVVMGRQVLYYGQVPTLDVWAIGFSAAALMCLAGVYLFASLERRFIYYA